MTACVFNQLLLMDFTANDEELMKLYGANVLLPDCKSLLMHFYTVTQTNVEDGTNISTQLDSSTEESRSWSQHMNLDVPPKFYCEDQKQL